MNPLISSLRTTRAAAGSVLVAVLMVGAVFGIAAAVDALWPDQEVAAAAPPAAFDASQEARDNARLRCDSCGVIAAIRPLPGANGVAGFEFAVRLADGSTRLTTSRTQDSWRVGDRIRVMAGSSGRAAP